MVNKTIDVMVLSAGKGTRVKKEFGDTPKALIKQDGVMALSRVLFPFRVNSSNIPYRIFLNIRKDEYEHFKNLGYDLLVEENPLGNAGAIKFFGDKLSDPFLVIHNDVDLRDIDPSHLYIEHLQNDSCVTMTVTNMAKEKERGVIVKKYNKVLAFTRDRYVNCGIYCVSHRTFENIDDGFKDIDNDLIPTLSSIHQLSCYDYKGHYEDWGK